MAKKNKFSLDRDAFSSFAGSASDFVTDLSSAFAEEQKQALLSNYDNRQNPLSTIKKSNRLDTGDALLSGAAKGAAAGTAIAPGIGTAIGAGVGFLASGIGRLFGAKNRREELSGAVRDWSSNWASKNADYLKGASYKDGGGVIKGKGTAKSDSIKTNLEDGSFIVPAENADKGMIYGKKYLGWTDNSVAERSSSGNDKVSNGEVLYTPEEVGVLKYHGVNLDDLAPKSETYGVSNTNNYADGGYKYDPDLKRVIGPGGEEYDAKGNIYQQGEQPGEMFLGTKESKEGLDIFNKYYTPSKNLTLTSTPPDTTTLKSGMPAKKDPNERKWYDYVPEFAGAIQTLGGAAGLIAAGREPDITVSDTLKKLSSETRRLAEYGYDPASLNTLDTQIEKTRRDISKSVTDQGGSPMEVMAKLQQVLSTTIDKKAGVMFNDAREKARKWADVMKVDSQIAGQEFDISKINLANWYKTQDVFAGMLSSGIANTIGASQLKREQDAMKKINENGKLTF